MNDLPENEVKAVARAFLTLASTATHLEKTAGVLRFRLDREAEEMGDEMEELPIEKDVVERLISNLETLATNVTVALDVLRGGSR